MQEFEFLRQPLLGELAMSRKKKEERRRKNAIYSGHIRLCQQPRAAHALRSDQYEKRLGNMTSGFLDGAGRLLQQARDTETMYFQHLLDQAEGAPGLDQDLILDTVALCHDSHQAVLDKQQENLRLAVSTWREEHFRCLRDDEFERSRSRVLEICHFTDKLRQELEDMEVLPSHGLDAEEGMD